MSPIGDLGERGIKKSVCVALNSGPAAATVEALQQAGWTAIVLESVDELKTVHPDAVGCLLLDGSCQPLVGELLDWCEQSRTWRKVPKVVMGSTSTAYSHVLHVSADMALASLPEVLVQAQHRLRSQTSARLSDRRTGFRHRCNLPCTVQQPARFIDLSLGGASIIMAYPIPHGIRIFLRITDSDPFLQNVLAEVLDSAATEEGYRLHLRFVETSPATERALQKHLLALQIRSLQTRLVI